MLINDNCLSNSEMLIYLCKIQTKTSLGLVISGCRWKLRFSYLPVYSPTENSLKWRLNHILTKPMCKYIVEGCSEIVSLH